MHTELQQDQRRDPAAQQSITANTRQQRSLADHGFLSVSSYSAAFRQLKGEKVTHSMHDLDATQKDIVTFK